MASMMELGGLGDDLKQSEGESKISPCERLRGESQPDRQTYPLSLSPAGRARFI